jgi:hypothetical protein
MPAKSHVETDWSDQWARVQRWHVRVEEVRKGGWSSDKDRALDTIFAFYMNCFHLGDWLKESGLCSDEDLINMRDEYGQLGLCRDIANGMKHMRVDLNHHPIEPNWGTATAHVTFVHTDGSIPFGLWVFKLGDGSSFDMFDLASQCMEIWRLVLERFGAASA